MANVWFEAPRRGAVARAQVASIADVRAIERTPFLALLPSWSILGVIEHAAAQSPGKTAIIVLDKGEPARAGRRLTYARLAATIRATANRLHEASGNSRPVVSILTPLLAESFIATWAGATAGIANPINPFLRVEHVANIMNAAGTTVLVCGTASDGPGAWNEVEKLRAMVPTLREVWCVDHPSGNDFFRPHTGTVASERLDFERAKDAERTAALLHTGGTTAAPKLVRLTEQGMLLNAWCCGTWNGSGPAEVVAVGMPYFHVGGAMCLALASMVFGQTMIIRHSLSVPSRPMPRARFGNGGYRGSTRGRGCSGDQRAMCHPGLSGFRTQCGAFFRFAVFGRAVAEHRRSLHDRR